MKPLSIVHVTSEYAPLVRIGGRADMVGGLAREQAKRGHHVIVALPHYAAITLPPDVTRRPLGGVDVPWGMGRERATFEVIETSATEPRLLLVGHAGARGFYARPGIYDDPETGAAYGDNAERFLFFARAALEGLKRLGERVHVLHAHDHQAAWAPCFVRSHDAGAPPFANVATVFTIHNLGYQGLYDSWVLALAGFAPDQFFPGAVFEFWGRVNFMKIGIAFADRITTVSPRHAREIQTTPEFGFGLEGLLGRRAADLTGVLNGIEDGWSPATDPWIARQYDASCLALKAQSRAALAAECGFDVPAAWPLVGISAGLEEQKGWDLVVQAAAELLQMEARFVFMGRGQARYRDELRALADAHPDRVFFKEARDQGFLHRMLAGCDLLLVPSRFEPCGLNQMIAQRYGTPPLVHAIGGLADSVEEFDPLTGTGTGFRFDSFASPDLVAALRHALALSRQAELWSKLQTRAMARDFSWGARAAEYDAIYSAAREKVRVSGAPTLDSVRAMIELRAKSAAS